MSEWPIASRGHGAYPHFYILDKLEIVIKQPGLCNGPDEGVEESLKGLLEGGFASRFGNQRIIRHILLRGSAQVWKVGGHHSPLDTRPAIRRAFLHSGPGLQYRRH